MRCIHDYNKKVTIEQLATTAADAHGHIDKTQDSNWLIYCRAWCAVQSKGGREFWKVQQVQADVSHVWFSQWSALLSTATTDMRLKYDGEVYEILSVIDVDLDRKEVQIQTRKAV